MKGDTVVNSEVWCYERDEDPIMGTGKSGDSWMPITFDMNDVLTVKEAGGNDFTGEGKTTIFIGGRDFIINMEFEKAKQLFHDSRK